MSLEEGSPAAGSDGALSVPPTDRFTRLIARVMRTGLLLASALLLAGLILWAALGAPSGAEQFSGANLIVSPSAGAWAVLLVAGLVTLTLTPYARVLISAATFRKQGDRTYVYVTAFVLVVLSVSALVGWLA